MWFCSLMSIDPSNPDSFPVDELVQCTTLDRCQADAVKAALTREMALIQGPPGTGKDPPVSRQPYVSCLQGRRMLASRLSGLCCLSRKRRRIDCPFRTFLFVGKSHRPWARFSASASPTMPWISFSWALWRPESRILCGLAATAELRSWPHTTSATCTKWAWGRGDMNSGKRSSRRPRRG